LHESDAIDLCNYNSKSMCQVSKEKITSEVQKCIYVLHLRRLIKTVFIIIVVGVDYI